MNEKRNLIDFNLNNSDITSQLNCINNFIRQFVEWLQTLFLLSMQLAGKLKRL